MTSWDHGLLDDAQSAFVRAHLEDPVLVEDLSWGLIDTRVLRVSGGAGEFIVKAGGPENHHLGREITAHLAHTGSLVGADRTASLIGADRDLRILVIDYQPGILVDGSPQELDPSVHAQAGAVLRMLHEQEIREDSGYEHRATEKALAWLDRPHRIAADIEVEARRILTCYRPGLSVAVPTHGDWQPRNWLLDDDRLRVIDFGRFDFRPPATDLCRLATQQWREVPALADVFVNAYGSDPREEPAWSMELLRQAVGTACWAFLVGDTSFEADGHALLIDALARF